MQTSTQICLLASTIAKGGAGMVALAGQLLNLELQELKLKRNLKVNRVTQTLNVATGSNGPFNLESDYLRTYDMFYPLQTPNGMTQFLTPITMEQYDQEWKGIQVANYPYEFATDLSDAALAASTIAGTVNGVLSIAILTPGVTYTGIPAVGFSGGGGGTGAVAAAHLGIVIVNFAVGAGYAVGDVILGAAGTFTRPIKLVVSAIGGGGSVSSLVIDDIGDYSALPGGGSATTTNGAGAGFTLSPVSSVLSSIVVTAPGSYPSAPIATVTGGGAAKQGTLAVTWGSTSSTPGGGQLYIYPQSNGALAITHRYMKNQPDLVSPETSATVPWFADQQYLVHKTAALMMGVTGDDRQPAFLAQAEAMLHPYLIMEGDEQQTVRIVRLDPRHFRSPRGVRPTKVNPW